MRFNQILMAAATQAGGAAAADPYGPELVTNGDMSSGTGWSLSDDNGVGGTLVISGGKMTATDAAPEEGQTATQNPDLIVATYHCVYTIDSISGTGATVTVTVGDGIGIARTTAGTYTEDIANTNADTNIFQLSFSGTAWVAVLDNASLKRVL